MVEGRVNRRNVTKGLWATYAGLALEHTAAAKDATDASADMQLEKFSMPAEDGPHDMTFMQWPVSVEVYGQKLLREVQSDIARIANAIARYEPVAVMADPEAHRAARAVLGPKVDVWDIPADDLWCRDSGPTFVRDKSGRLAVSHIAFNGWGNKQKHARDGKIASRIAERLKLPLLSTGLKGEQGGVEHDGEGTLLAHASCWVNPNRNAGTQDAIGAKLLKALGGKKIIWAPGIKDADITDYHIDALARFVAPARVLIQLPDRIISNDPWSKAAYETYEILKKATDAGGRKLELIVVPEPKKPRVTAEDFVASYVNYYICNGAVISPEFGDDETDAKALAILKSLYPGREIVTLNIDAIGRSGGGIHCATQQMPKAQAI